MRDLRAERREMREEARSQERPTPRLPGQPGSPDQPRSSEHREKAIASTVQDALAPQVDALNETPSGMDALEAFDHLGRAADALHYGTPGAIGKTGCSRSSAWI